ncbi:MAG TPA: hypothetical protein PLT83_06850 [Thermoleophilia bacterium]|nr:hypothetical protein [Thermoleophilia bacterium]HQG55188.1 hypothetical protein [Thermoleophilia bacterium]
MMRRTGQIFAAVFIVLGALLVIRGLWNGVWPVSLQLIAGAALIVYGVLRLKVL